MLRFKHCCLEIVFGRKERGRAEGALNSEGPSELFWVASVCKKCIGTQHLTVDEIYNVLRTAFVCV